MALVFVGGQVFDVEDAACPVAFVCAAEIMRQPCILYSVITSDLQLAN